MYPMVIPEERTLFRYPINRRTTAYFYPDRMDLKEFIAEMKSAIRVFENDMGHYASQGDPRRECAPKHIEAWVELWLTRSEIGQEKVVHYPEPRMREIEDFKREIMNAV